MLLGLAGVFRASELVGLNVERAWLEHAGGLRVLVARSKVDQLEAFSTSRVGTTSAGGPNVTRWYNCGFLLDALDMYFF